jgi:hypothetical protein
MKLLTYIKLTRKQPKKSYTIEGIPWYLVRDIYRCYYSSYVLYELEVMIDGFIDYAYYIG